MEFEKKSVLKVIRTLKKNGLIRDIGREFQSAVSGNKNSDESIEIRKKADGLFNEIKHDAKIHEELWKLYTESIALAPNDSEELAAGYANRAVLLLHLKKYKECLLDIDRALKITESYTLKIKLYCRQNQCHVALQDGKERASIEKANFWLSKIDKANEKNKLEELIEKMKNISTTDKLKSVQEEKEYGLSCENNAVRMSYNEKYGKHLVADRDIHVGELIYIENFYVTSVNSKRSYAYCSHCLAISWATVPCEECSYYMFCSEKCREEAWLKYHSIECFVKFERISHEKHLIDSFIHLGLRALIMGFNETGSIAKLQELTNEIDKCTDLEKKGLDKDGNFSMDSFRSMYSLKFSKCAYKIKSYIHWALDILVSLAQNTDILGKDFKYTNNIDLVNNESAIFVTSLLVRLFSICSINTFELLSEVETCKAQKSAEGCIISCCCCRGVNISLFTSLINHSCDNNVDKLYTNDGRVAYYAVQPIEKNTQIFSRYYVNFITGEKSARNSLLSNMFEFTCDCVACTNGWATLEATRDEETYTTTPLEIKICAKYEKTFKKLEKDMHHRFSTKTISSFMQDMEFLLKSGNGPTHVTTNFRVYLLVMITSRYFKKLIIPSECDRN